VRVEGVNSANGITVGADATACVCIDDDDEAMLYSAVERLMGKDLQQIHDQVQQTPSETSGARSTRPLPSRP
jgi:hypothetical protein